MVWPQLACGNSAGRLICQAASRAPAAAAMAAPAMIIAALDARSRRGSTRNLATASQERQLSDAAA